MPKLTLSPILRSLRDLDGIKVSSVQDWIEDFMYDLTCLPRRSKYWFLRKFTKTKIKVPELHGGYHDTDTIMLYTNFQLLVTFMEEEVAHMYDICLKDYEPAKHLTPKTKREKAETYYLWEDDMTGRSQQEIDHYKEQKERELKIVNLYRWWKDERPARKDKWEELVAWEKETGFVPFHFKPSQNNCSEMVSHDSHPLWPKYRQLTDAAAKTDEDWQAEDTEKLKQLIELRHHLWT